MSVSHARVKRLNPRYRVGKKCPPYLLLLGSLFLAPTVARADMYYSVEPLPTQQTLAVSITDDRPADVEDFRIPAWSPGFYFLEKYQDKISNVRATDEAGANLAVRHPEAHTWEVRNPAKRHVTLSYRVVGDDPGLGFFGTNVQLKTAYWNGASALMYSDGRLLEPAHLKIRLPAGWDAATGMDKGADGNYLAEGYDELIDHPFQLGKFERRTFIVGQLPFEAIWVSPNGQFAPDINVETEILRKVSAPALKLFGGASFTHYTYIFHLAVGNFDGGLEHRASTVMALPNQQDLGLDALAAHEYFHAWNVKQIRPKILGPFDYSKEQRTGNLWFSEGVTDYYAKMTTYRSGAENRDWLRRQLSAQIAQYEAGSMRKKITLEEASRGSWEHGGFSYGDLDYYNKGLLAGFIFDAAIREASSGAKSLDDVMRLMYAKYKLPNPGFPEDGIRTAINEVAGKDLSTLYNRLIRSTQELPYEQFAAIGLRVVRPGQNYAEPLFTVASGKISSLDPSLNGSLAVGDEVRKSSFDGGTFMSLRVLRGGKELQIQIPVRILSSDERDLQADPFASDEAKARLLGWLAR